MIIDNWLRFSYDNRVILSFKHISYIKYSGIGHVRWDPIAAPCSFHLLSCRVLVLVLVLVYQIICTKSLFPTLVRAISCRKLISLKIMHFHKVFRLKILKLSNFIKRQHWVLSGFFPPHVLVIRNAHCLLFNQGELSSYQYLLSFLNQKTSTPAFWYE